MLGKGWAMDLCFGIYSRVQQSAAWDAEWLVLVNVLCPHLHAFLQNDLHRVAH